MAIISVFDWQASSMREGIDGQIVGLSGIVSQSWSLFPFSKAYKKVTTEEDDRKMKIILKIESFQLYIV